MPTAAPAWEKSPEPSFPRAGTLKETARACIDFGYRAFRFHGADPDEPPVFDNRKQVDKTYAQCQEVREGVGEDGDWAIDFHTRFDYADAVRLCGLIEPLRRRGPGAL